MRMRVRVVWIGWCIWLASVALGVGRAQEVPPETVSRLEYDKLKKQYDAVVADRDNIAAQTKLLLDYKSKYNQYEVMKQSIQADKDRFQSELDNRKAQIKLLQDKIEELQRAHDQAVEANQDLKNSLEKIQIEYKIIPETRKEMARLQKQIEDLTRTVKLAQQQASRAEDDKLNAFAQAESNRRQLITFRKNYEQALAKNRALEKKIAAIPSKFAEMARENKVLIKETALMHYNLGVFYTQSKEYSRAIAEFEKATELNPDDPYAYYNLGYIYAEYVANRSKAIECFRHFLKLAKSEDKDIDWVKKYILTWQTWEAKKPME